MIRISEQYDGLNVKNILHHKCCKCNYYFCMNIKLSCTRNGIEGNMNDTLIITTSKK